MAEGTIGPVGSHEEKRKRQPRIFKERKDVLNMLSDADLVKRYRLDRAGIIHLTDLVRTTLESPTMRNMSVTPEMKILTTLRYLVTGRMQDCTSEDIGVSQATISRMISHTVDTLASPSILTRFIRFPNNEQEIQRIQGEFLEIGGFPGTLGVIDGTHIKIMAPRENPEEYCRPNRKNFHSINVQIVFDAKCRVLDVVANWPGSIHDAKILNESGLKKKIFDKNLLPVEAHLIGDNNYPCKRWLLTPYLRPQNETQAAYNRAHRQTSSVVERGLAQLKSRFQVLRSEMRIDPDKTCKVILICAALHNFCMDRNIPQPETSEENAINEDGPEMDYSYIQPLLPDLPQDGLQFRDEFANTHFKRDPPTVGAVVCATANPPDLGSIPTDGGHLRGREKVTQPYQVMGNCEQQPVYRYPTWFKLSTGVAGTFPTTMTETQIHPLTNRIEGANTTEVQRMVW